MARKSVVVKAPTKVQPVWQIGIMFPDGKKIVKPRCTLNELLETYFLNLDEAPDIEPEELLSRYKNIYKDKNIKVAINYIDSWGHKWTGKIAWPKDDKFINYLNQWKQSN